jgi:hypothetical protein
LVFTHHGASPFIKQSNAQDQSSCSGWLCFCWPLFLPCSRSPPAYIWKGTCWIQER